MQRLLVLPAVGIFLVSASAFSQATFSGYMFGDYYYNVARDSSFNHTPPSYSGLSASAPGPKAMQAFQFRRIYFTMDDNISGVFSTRLRLEADQAATPGITSPVGTNPPTSEDELVSGKVAPYIKEAWLRWKNIFAGSNFTLGLQLTPGFALTEAAWGNRFLQRTLMDQNGIVSAFDLGMSLRGKLTPDSMVNYWVMIGNNDVTSTIPENNKYKRYYANIQVLPATNWQATAYVDYADAGDIPNIARTALVLNSALTEALFAGYGKSSLSLTGPTQTSVGAEVFMQEQSNGYKTSSGNLAARNVLGYWVYGEYYFIPEISAVARYDHFDPNTGSDNAAKGDSRNYALGGIVFRPDKSVFISPNLLWESYATPVGGTAIKPSVTARLTFWYLYM